MYFGCDLYGLNELLYLVMVKEVLSFFNGIYLLIGKFNDLWMYLVNCLIVKEKFLMKFMDC